jgi:hypothetical protein
MCACHSCCCLQTARCCQVLLHLGTQRAHGRSVLVAASPRCMQKCIMLHSCRLFVNGTRGLADFTLERWQQACFVHLYPPFLAVAHMYVMP